MHPDAYPVPAAAGSAEIRIKGSRFLASSHPCREESLANTLIAEINSRYPDACHHCWAFSLGHPDNRFQRYSDDGEPGGSAGPPIARAILSSGLSDIVCVVTRWFGGTKLGVGGLIRAYGQAARESLHQIEPGECLQTLKLQGQFPYELEPQLRSLLARLHGVIMDTEYGAQVTWTLKLPPSAFDRWQKTAADLSSGRLIFKILDP
jgi:uncharacterized YigZ family protein